jgi:hypothetical protein
MTPWQQDELGKRLVELNCSELINGGCIGADEESILIALQVGVRIFHLYPSYLKHKQGEVVKVGDSGGQYVTRTLEVFGEVSIKIEKEEAPLTRNIKIVDESDILIACPKEHVHTLRSGTWATVRYAWKRKKKVIVIPPIEREDDNGNENEPKEADLPPAV